MQLPQIMNVLCCCFTNEKKTHSVKQVLNSTVEASCSIFQFSTATQKENAFSLEQMFPYEWQGQRATSLFGISEMEKAKSISLRRPRCVIRIGLLWQAASFSSWNRYSLKETRRKGSRGSQAHLIGFAQESDYTFRFPTALPPFSSAWYLLNDSDTP